MRSSRSSSSASSHSNSSLHDAEADNISIFVKLLSGETIPLNLPSSTPIATLLELLSLRTSIPATNLRIHLAGKHLTPTPTTPSPELSSVAPTPTLASLSVSPSSTLTLSLPLLGGMASTSHPTTTTTTTNPSSGTSPSTSSTPTPPASRKPRIQRCTHKSCNAPAQRIVGDCGFCAGHFCGRHRMLEDHRCAGLEDCKKESHERNADKLNSERTMVVRGI